MGVTTEVSPVMFAIQTHLWEKLQVNTLTVQEFKEVLLFSLNEESCIMSLHLSAINGFND